MTAYLSGPISGVPDYKAHFNAAETTLLAMGVTQVINPARVPQRDDWEWQDYLLHDLRMMRDAEVLVQLPGWHASRGVMVERLWAFCIGVPVVALADMQDYLVAQGIL